MKNYYLLLSMTFIFFMTKNGYSQLEVESNGDLKIGENAKTHISNTARYGEAAGFIFDTRMEGVFLEQGVSESSGFYADGDFAVIWSPGDQGRLLRVYDEDGMKEKWYLDGNGNAFTVSDERKKENISELTNVLASVKQIKTVKYNYKKNSEENDKVIRNTQLRSMVNNPNQLRQREEEDSSNKKYYGFLAQDIEKMFPQLVDTSPKGDKFVNYNGVIPILLAAIKEQQAIIEKQNLRIEAIEKKIH